MSSRLGFAWRSFAREWRSGELALLLAALVVAVTAMTAVGFFTERIGRAIDQQAAEILAADLVLRSGRPIPARVLAAAEDRGLAAARKLSFPSVVVAGEASALVEIEAVSPGYPLRGRLRTSQRAYGPEQIADGIPAPGEAWAEARILGLLGLDVGAQVTVGAKRLEITRVLAFAPDRGWSFADFAPALLMNLEDVAATELIQPGSRVYHYALFAGPAAAVAGLRERLRPELEPGERLRNLDDARPEIRSILTRARQFLGLAALAGTLLAAVAVAMAARRYARRHLDTAALLKCLGASQATITRGIVLQLTLLALAGGVLGSLLGLAAQSVLGWLASGFLDTALPAPTGRTAWLGLAVAASLLGGFAMPPLLALRRVPPARVLRRDLGPVRLPQLALYGSAALAIGLLLAWIARDPRLVSFVVLGAGATVALLALAGWLLVGAVQRLRGGVGVAWRYGLSNIGRRGNDSIVQLVAFGLGLMVLLLLSYVRSELMTSWQASLPPDAPNHFLINIQSDQREAVREFIVDRSGVEPELAPLVRARLTHVNGTHVRDMTFPSERGRRFADREGNLSWAETLRPDNRLVAGSWWDEAPGAARVSVELEFAESLGLELGDELRFDVAGETLSAAITSVREVQWDSMQPNFFMLLEPGLLADYPATHIASFYLPPERKGMLLDLVHRFPSVTPLDMDAIFAQVRGVMDRAALAVEYVFLFTIVAGVLVLAAAVQATRDERLYESAMLRTLGASRRMITQGLAAEFGTLGLLAGLLAAGGASIAGYLLATQVFELAYAPAISVWLAGLAAGVVLVGGSGLAATRSVAREPPATSLRRL